MELTFFDDIPEVSRPDFLDESMFKSKKLSSKHFEVTEIFKAKSGKGYCLVTEEFMHFIWNNDKTTKFLIEALDVWCKKGEGKPIYIVLGKTFKEKPRLAANKTDNRTWFTNGKKYSLEEIDEPGLIPEVNPFL